MHHVLIVEDAPEATELLTALLRGAGFRSSSAPDGRSALELARAHRPDFVLLDLGLPDTDGVDLCRELRTFSDAHIIMLTARTDEIDRVLGLKMGADDYVTKPYSPRELLARVEAVVRRRGRSDDPATAARRQLGDLEVRTDAHQVLLDGQELELTRIEFAILDALTEHPDRVVSRTALRERVWGGDWNASDHAVDVHMANLRRKLDRNGRRHVRTVRGVGYAMAEA